MDDKDVEMGENDSLLSNKNGVTIFFKEKILNHFYNGGFSPKSNFLQVLLLEQIILDEHKSDR